MSLVELLHYPFFSLRTGHLLLLLRCLILLISVLTILTDLLDLGDGRWLIGQGSVSSDGRQVGAGGIAAGIAVTLLLFAGLQASASVIFAVLIGEVCAKFSMALLTSYGTPFREGMHSYLHQFSQPYFPLFAALFCIPLVFLPVSPFRLAGAAIAMVVCPVILFIVSKRLFGGVNGDVVGASKVTIAAYYHYRTHLKSVSYHHLLLPDYPHYCLMRTNFGIHMKGGVITERDPEFCTIRIRTPAGILSGEQLRGIAAIAKKYGSGVVHCTRQLWVPSGDSLKSKKPWKNGTPVGSEKDEVVNIIACPGLERCKFANIDTISLAKQLDQKLFGKEMPVKMRIAISGCPNSCTSPMLNEIGIMGRIRPLRTPGLCTGCGTCVEYCKKMQLS
jgi:ferredoxin